MNDTHEQGVMNEMHKQGVGWRGMKRTNKICFGWTDTQRYIYRGGAHLKNLFSVERSLENT